MRDYSFKILMTVLAILCLVPAMQAQFDDVYYDPDDVQTQSYNNDYASNQGNTDDVTYYDDDEYAYYDDYDYYYSSRIKRFHRPYRGFSFYDPVYVSYNYYDPFFHNSYFYPGSSIYISFGNNDYWGYRNWRRWNRYNSWNSWCYSPATYYYSYNSWHSHGHHHGHNYWNGYHGYHSYSNYYNNYYNGSPYPISYYNGITQTTINNINNGGSRGTYYGPRTGGGIGSSPRGPVDKPGFVQPVMREGVTSETPGSPTDGGTGNVTSPVRTNPAVSQENTPGIGNPTPPTNPRTSNSPANVATPDKETGRNDATPTSQRPIFKPYPTEDKPVRTSPAESTRQPAETRPSTPGRESNATRPPATQPERSDNDNVRPQYQPSPRNERPTYTPRTEERPRYVPPTRNERPAQRAEEQPRNTPPPARSERSEAKPSQRNDSGSSRESYSPPQRSEPSRSYSPPSRSESSSSGSSRSSSSGGGSPRSGGRS